MFEQYCVYNFSDFTPEFNSVTINWGPTCMLGIVPLSPRHNYKCAWPLSLKDSRRQTGSQMKRMTGGWCLTTEQCEDIRGGSRGVSAEAEGGSQEMLPLLLPLGSHIHPVDEAALGPGLATFKKCSPGLHSAQCRISCVINTFLFWYITV